MSLFQVNEWWRCSRTVTEEECGTGCLCVANIDNDSDGYDKIILGSYSGLLHIYSPQRHSTGLHDSLLEANLESPILQLSVGRFVPVDKDIHLAVLHPRLLTVYKFTKSVGEQEVSLKMQKIYQHKLERSAANMVGGPFGGIKDRDFICVQSLDGVISVFEQETYAFKRFLPGFLLPGPLAYTSNIDSFLTASSSQTLEAYSYQVLAVATDTKTDEESSDHQSGKKIEADWSFVLGENAMEIQVVNFPQKKPLIVVLGEHSLFCFDTTGKLDFMKKFEDPLSCFKSYSPPEGKFPITIACTHSKQLLVYEGAVLNWAAKLDDEAVIVETGNFSGCQGLIVIATEQCDVSCHFLGTSPTLFSLPRSKQRNLSLDKVDKELRDTKLLISQHLAKSGDALEDKETKKDLMVSLTIPKTIDKASVASKRANVAQEFPSLTIQITLKVSRRINDVQVLIPIEKPLHSTLSSHSFPSVYDVEHPVVLHASFYLVEKLIPSSLNRSVMVYFRKTNGTPQVMTSNFRLPLSLIASPCAPIKKLDQRVTLDTNMPCVNLLEIFSDFEGDQNGPTCIGMSYMNGAKATILTAKSSNRYRIQCEEIDQLWLIVDELVYRLRQRYPQIHFTLSEPPNLEDYVPYIDEHFKLRKSVDEMRVLLQQRAQQHRIIQKRLLTRFKDKTPQPMLGLDTLLLGTHAQILALVDAMEENDKRLRHCSVKLSCAIRLLVLLISLWRHFSKEEEERLNAAMVVDLTYTQCNAAGWEEMVDASLTALLKTILSRSAGDTPLMPSTASLESSPDTVKLQKHIAIVMDRLAKGAKLIGAKEKAGKQSSLTHVRKQDSSSKGQSPDDFSSMFSSPKSNIPHLPEPQLRLQPKPIPQTSIAEEDERERTSEKMQVTEQAIFSPIEAQVTEKDSDADEAAIDSSFLDIDADDLLR